MAGSEVLWGTVAGLTPNKGHGPRGTGVWQGQLQLGKGTGYRVPGQPRALSISCCWVMSATLLTTPGLGLLAIVGHPQPHLPRFPQKVGVSVAMKKVKMGIEMPCM